MFPGQGSQWAGMGARTAGLPRRCSPTRLARVRGGAGAARGLVAARGAARRPGRAGLDRVDVVQPALFAVMVSLAAVWRSLGVRAGRGGRPLARARSPRRAWPARCRWRTAPGWWRCAAGRCGRWPGAAGWSRSRCRPSAAPSCSPPWGERLARRGGQRARPPWWSPASRGALDELLAELRGRRSPGAAGSPVDYASHSAQVGADRATSCWRRWPAIAPRRPRVPFYSTVTGDRLGHAGAGRRLLVPEPAPAPCGSTTRHPRRCWTTATGCSSRSSPHPVLTAGDPGDRRGGRRGRRAWSARCAATRAARRGCSASLAEAAVRGVPVDWAPCSRAGAPRAVRPADLRVPAQRLLAGRRRGGDRRPRGGSGWRRPGTRCSAPRSTLADGGRPGAHRPAVAARPTRGWPTTRSTGRCCCPAPRSWSWRCGPATRSAAPRVEELTLEAPLVLPGRRRGRSSRSWSEPRTTDGRAHVGRLLARRRRRRRTDGAWTRHATGRADGGRPAPSGARLRRLAAAGAEPVDVDGASTRRLAEARLRLRARVPGPARRVAARRRGVRRGRAARGGSGGRPVRAAPGAARRRAARAGARPVSRPDDGQTGPCRLPFAWTGVSLHAAGRARAAGAAAPPAGRRRGDAGRRRRARRSGRVDALVLRPVPAAARTPAASRGRPGRCSDSTGSRCRRRGRRRRRRTPGVGRAAATDPLRPAGLRSGTAVRVAAPARAVAGGARYRGAVLPARGRRSPRTWRPGDPSGRGAALVQGWLADDRLADARLVVVTRARSRVGAAGDVARPGRRAGLGPGALGPVREPGPVRPGRPRRPRRRRRRIAALADAAARCDRARTSRSSRSAAGARAGRRGWCRRDRAGELLAPPDGAAWRLDADRRGRRWTTWPWSPCPEPAEPLAPGQVRVAVRAAGLNFRDVLIALGMYPGDGAARQRGRRRRHRDRPGRHRARRRRPGHGPVRRRRSARSRSPTTGCWSRIPDGWSFAQAAAVPVAFLTAYYGLVDLAGLRAGRAGPHPRGGRRRRHGGRPARPAPRRRGFAHRQPGKWDAAAARMGLDDDHIASSRDLRLRGRRSGRRPGPRRGRGAQLAGRRVHRRLAAAAAAPAAGSWRWARPTSATRHRSPPDHPGVAYRAFDLIGTRARTGSGEMLAEVRRGCSPTGALQPAAGARPGTSARRRRRSAT